MQTAAEGIGVDENDRPTELGKKDREIHGDQAFSYTGGASTDDE